MGEWYDFKINQTTCVQALETYRKMEILLERERDAQLENTIRMREQWNGESAEVYEKKTIAFLNQGKYHAAWRKVKKMREMLEEMLPEINRILAIGDSFIDQLRSDEYVYPVIPAMGDNTLRNGGILGLDYDLIGVMLSLCNKIEAESKDITKKLIRVIYDCGNILDSTEADAAEVYAASRKLERIGNFRNAFCRFANEVRELEFQMNLQMCALAEDEEELGEKNGISEAELTSGIMDIDDTCNATYLSVQDWETLMQQYLQEGNIEGMRQIAVQIFAKDCYMWSEAEALFIAQSLHFAFETENLEMIELYTGNMLNAHYSEPEELNMGIVFATPKYCSVYQVQPDVKMIQLIKSNLNPDEQGMTYYTLNRMENMQLGKLQIIHQLKDLYECGSFAVDAQQVNGKIQLSFGTQIPAEKTFYLAPHDTQYLMTVYDMGEVISLEELSALKFSEEQTEELRLSVVSDTDVLFMDYLTSGNYAQAFDIPTHELSTQAGNGLTCYIMDLELNDQTREIQNVVNEILKTDPNSNYFVGNKSGKYIDLIQQNLECRIDEINKEMLCLEDIENGGMSLVEEGDRVYKQIGLWGAVEKVYRFELGFEDLSWLEHDYLEGECHAQISELSDGIGMADVPYDFRVDIVYPEDGMHVLENDLYISVDTSRNIGGGYASATIRIDMEELRMKQQEVVEDAIYEAVGNAFNPIVYGASYIIPIVDRLSEDEFGAIGDAAVDTAYEAYDQLCRKNDLKTMPKALFLCGVEAYLEYKELEQEIEAKQELLNNLEVAQALVVDIELRGHGTEEEISSEQVIGEGIILPQAIYHLSCLEKEGIAAYLKEIEFSEGEMRTAIDDLIYKNEGTDWQSFLCGGDWGKLSAEQFSKYIKDVKDYLESHYYGTYDISAWIRGDRTNESKEKSDN